MTQLRKIIGLVTWPLVALVGLVVVSWVAVVWFAPADSRELLLGGNGLVATVIGYFLRSPIAEAAADVIRGDE